MIFFDFVSTTPESHLGYYSRCLKYDSRGSIQTKESLKDYKIGICCLGAREKTDSLEIWIIC